MEILQSFAEISISVAGFSAIVVIFKDKSHESWNHMVFNGMIGHALIAFIFSCFPFLLINFLNEYQTLAISSFLIGLLTFLQGTFAAILDRKARIIVRLLLVAGTLTVTVFQILNLTETYFERNIGPYIIGVFWHLFQACMIFAMFVWSGPPTGEPITDKGNEEKRDIVSDYD